MTRAVLVEAAAKANWKGLRRVQGENSESVPVDRELLRKRRK